MLRLHFGGLMQRFNDAGEKLKAKGLLTQALYFIITLEIHVNYMRNAIVERETVTKTLCFPLRQGLLARFKITVKRFRCISDVTF